MGQYRRKDSFTFYLDLECDFICCCLTGVMAFVTFLGILDYEFSLSPFGDEGCSLVLSDLHLVFSPNNECTGRSYFAAQLQISFQGRCQARRSFGFVQKFGRLILGRNKIK